MIEFHYWTLSSNFLSWILKAKSITFCLTIMSFWNQNPCTVLGHLTIYSFYIILTSTNLYLHFDHIHQRSFQIWIFCFYYWKQHKRNSWFAALQEVEINLEENVDCLFLTMLQKYLSVKWVDKCLRNVTKDVWHILPQWIYVKSNVYLNVSCVPLLQIII